MSCTKWIKRRTRKRWYRNRVRMYWPHAKKDLLAIRRYRRAPKYLKIEVGWHPEEYRFYQVANRLPGRWWALRRENESV
jgi:hypothetical protein